MGLTTEQIKSQSRTAIRQWGPQWREHSKYLSKYEMKSLKDFEGIGIGRPVLLIANGASFEREIETIKKYQGNVDIMVCDKALGSCLDNGIIPTYVIVCDANVSFERYMEKWKDQLSNTILFSNVCANPKWADYGNWKDRYFFVNKDSIQSEEEFSVLSGCKNFIAAGTNVSNCMVIFMTQCDNEKRINFFGYDKILLIGFDYSWEFDGNYYAFDHTGNGKRYYMRHIYGINIAGRPCYTSNNLVFSAEWLKQYITAFRLPVIQCSKHTLFPATYQGDLAEQMQYRYKAEDAGRYLDLKNKKDELSKRLARIEEEAKSMMKDHFFSLIRTV